MIHDFTHAIRALTARRGFTAAAVATLALGIGANTAIFTVVYAVLLKPLPYAAPDRLVRITEGRPGISLNVSYPNFLDWRARNHVFDDLAIFNTFNRVVLPTAEGASVIVPGGTTEARLFTVMGISAARGRVFTDAEQQPSTPIVAVISDRLWRTRYGGDPSVIGRAVRMDEDQVTIAGVMPPEVRPFDVDIWFPMRQLSPMQLDRGNHPGFAVVARLRDGIDLAAAQRDMSAIAASLAREYPASNRDMGVFLRPLLDSVAGRARPMILLVAAAAGVLLLIACANVAHLLVARGLRRARETSIRAALGASRWRLLRLFFAEGLTLGIAGATAGLLLAAWSVRALRGVPGLALPRAGEIAIDPFVVGFAALLAVVTSVLFALAPSLHASKADLMDVLRQSGSGAGARTGGVRLRSVLVGGEVALLVVLLAAALLMQRSLARLAAVDPGFHADGLLAVPLVQPQSRYGDPDVLRSFERTLAESVGASAAVDGTALAWPFAYGGDFSWSPNINLPERPFEPGREPPAQASAVTPAYFATLGIPLIRGRLFGPQDRAGGTPVIVNQTFASRFFSGEDPIGKRVSALQIPEMQEMPIVGVVGDTRRGGMLRGFTPEIYIPYDRFPQSSPTLVVRATAGDPLRLASDIAARVGGIDRTIAVRSPRRVSDELASSYGDRRAMSWLLSVFAMLALGLTLVGIGSIVSFTVAQRTAEIGIRMALGADRGGVVRLVVFGALGPVAAGAAAGFAALGPLSRLLQSYLFGVSAFDPAALAGTCAVLLTGAAAAAYLPARQAAGIDPLMAMRRE
ncbi:MAG TPA: ABC transporter permease [Vicinamibacterales bacterium]|nr:ABC transporter permease [Vicinamibacterales bacterium]